MDLIVFLGYAAFFGLIALAIAIGFVSILMFLSLRMNRVYAPHMMLTLISAFESPLKSVFRFFHLNTSLIDKFLIDLANQLNAPLFSSTKFSERLLFIPQCLRNTNCPAKLSWEGIQCIGCGLCVIKAIKGRAEALGYRVFIVPGSSFIRRMIVKYRPAAIMGIGCEQEVKDGLEMCVRYKLPVRGIVLQRAGCVSTAVDVEDVMNALESTTAPRSLVFAKNHVAIPSGEVA